MHPGRHHHSPIEHTGRNLDRASFKARLARALLAGLAFLSLAAIPAGAATRPRHNVVLFVADGLRSLAVTPDSAPTLANLRAQGVDFSNSHSLYPTITTVNASAIATGHGIGDTGNFGNTIYTGAPLPSRKGAPVAPLENDTVLAELNARYGGNYLGAQTLLSAARQAGYSAAVIGKLGPVAIQAGGDPGVIVIDDDTGRSSAFPLAPDLAQAIAAAGLVVATPGRGANENPGDLTHPGTKAANVIQQDWFAAVATKVLLPRFKAAGKPFVLVFWSRDPDGTQHYQGDSPGSLSPGINGPTSKAAIRNADQDLARIQGALRALDVDKTTDIIVTADHGFSTISRESRTSPAARGRYPNTAPGQLPPTFLGLDLATALHSSVYDSPSGRPLDPAAGEHPQHGYALIGADSARPDVVVTSNGASGLIYLPGADARTRAPLVVQALLAQDYTGAVFVDDALGRIPGALPMSAVGLIGSALTPRPSIIVALRSFDTGCGELCQADINDTPLQVGQGMHGSFGRGDTHNFMAAIGPDFRSGFTDPAPVSNADLAPTTAHILGLTLSGKGRLRGRVISESLVGGRPVPIVARTERSEPWRGVRTVLNVQIVGGERYFDAAGIPGRTLGLKP